MNGELKKPKINKEKNTLEIQYMSSDKSLNDQL